LLNSRRVSMRVRVCADDIANENVYIDSDATSKTEGVKNDEEKRKAHRFSWIFAIAIYFTIGFVLFSSVSTKIGQKCKEKNRC
jgi:hypothetical protein